MRMFQPKSAQASRKSRASFRSKVDPVAHLSSVPALRLLGSSNEIMPEPRMSVQVGLGCEDNTAWQSFASRLWKQPDVRRPEEEEKFSHKNIAGIKIHSLSLSPSVSIYRFS